MRMDTLSTCATSPEVGRFQKNDVMWARIKKLTKTRIEIEIQNVSEPIFWEVPADMPLNLSRARLANFLAIAAFPFALRAGRNLKIDGKVDRELARNLLQFSIAWSQYRPEIFKRSVRVVANSYTDPVWPRLRRSGYACAYSGGIDSTFAMSLGRTKSHMREFPPISLAIMIDGFGFDLEEPQNFDRTFAEGKTYCAKLGVPLTSVRTNWPSAIKIYQLMHTIGIAAVFHLRADKVDGGYIGMDFTFDEEFELGPWGNSALMSRHYSAAGFQVGPTGGEVSRVRKLHALIKNGDDHHLTVCNNPLKLLKNCGTCEKCQRTMLAYRSLGKEPVEGMFQHALSLESAGELRISKLTQWVFYSRMARTWKNKRDPYLEIVRKMVTLAKAEGFPFNHDRKIAKAARTADIPSAVPPMDGLV